MTFGDSPNPGSGASAEEAFLAHWRALPREGLLPTLATFLDRADPRFAPWVYILDVVNADCLTVRLFGTRMAEAFGEITGLNFLDFLSRDLRGPIARAHQLICERPCGWVTHAHTVTTNGRAVILENVSLPVLHKGAPRCVVKLVTVLRELNYREYGEPVNTVNADHWIDLGASVPLPDAPL